MEDDPQVLDDDAMYLMGQEVSAYLKEQLATLNDRLAINEALLIAIKGLQTALTAPRVIVQDEHGRPVGVKILA